MPQVDLELLLSSGGGGSGSGGGDSPGSPPPAPPPVEDAYFPPESIQVAIGEGVDWTDLNVVYDREDSTKGSTNPKSSSANNPKSSRTGSDRFPLSSTSSAAAAAPTAIIGLSGKVQTAGHRCSRRPPQGLLLPKKDVHPDGGGGAAAAMEVEPGSPKVSCFGKVLSGRERERLRQRSLREREQPHAPPGPEGREQNKGCWAVFLCGGGGGRPRAEVREEEVAVFKEPKASPSGRGEKATASEPPSGRRAAAAAAASSWVEKSLSSEAAADGCDGGHVAKVGEEAEWGRRSVG